MKRVWRKVTESTLEYASGCSIFPPYLPLGNLWTLKLECGHTVERACRYTKHDSKHMSRGRGYWHRRSYEDALPAPKKVICHKCEREERRSETNS